jgi:hypothetical protein
MLKKDGYELKCFFGTHQWNGCKCSVCGKIRGEQHVLDDGCECKRCGYTNAAIRKKIPYPAQSEKKFLPLRLLSSSKLSNQEVIKLIIRGRLPQKPFFLSPDSLRKVYLSNTQPYPLKNAFLAFSFTVLQKGFRIFELWKPT